MMTISSTGVMMFEQPVIDLLKDSYTFKGKRAMPSYDQLAIAKQNVDEQLAALVTDAEVSLKKRFRSAFSTVPPYTLAFQKKRVGTGYLKHWLTWRRAGVPSAQASFVKMTDDMLAQLPDDTVRQIYIEYEQRRCVWQARYDAMQGYRLSLNSLDNFYVLSKPTNTPTLKRQTL